MRPPSALLDPESNEKGSGFIQQGRLTYNYTPSTSQLYCKSQCAVLARNSARLRVWTGFVRHNGRYSEVSDAAL